MTPTSSRRLSRSASTLDAMPSSERVSSSRKYRRSPNIMSRRMSRLQRSPRTSSVRLIGQPDLPIFFMTVLETDCNIGSVFVNRQPVAKGNRYGEDQMAKLIGWNLITVDGYFEGAKKWDLDFHNLAWGPELERLSEEFGDKAASLVFGRVTYEGMASYW